jgi:hypothetical protein
MAKRATEPAPAAIEDKQIVGLRYTGNGAYLPYVPARDLSATEVAQYQALLDEAREAGTFERLYEPIYADEIAPASESEVSNA